ncbi:BnaA10g17170D [Brassica napus]|uniref:BnaA10g17170D protein n=1 Tax=Brassica napus TaxID=3708 RepID=A0A078HLB0_BRANA|nr:BnaA10g17170D [Brassica napus]
MRRRRSGNVEGDIRETYFINYIVLGSM